MMITVIALTMFYAMMMNIDCDNNDDDRSDDGDN